MSLEQQINAAMTSALKMGRKLELATLRTIVAQIKDEQIKIGRQQELTDEDIIAVLQRAVKKRKEAIEMYGQGNRQDLVEKEEQEITIIQKYLPAQLSKDEITGIVNGVITELNVDSIKDLGKVMGAAMGKLKGKADGKLVQSVVRERLTQISQ
jgi:uncharacterized protein YqeY